MQVVIIGGGPSGAAAALTLLKAQVPVTIIEREPFPRYRPGETLHPGIEPLLARLGVADHLHAADYVRHLGVWSGWNGSMQFVPYGDDANGPWRGYQAVRVDFDHRLLESACTRGAKVRSSKVTGVLFNGFDDVAGVMTSEGPVQSTYVIDCSGNAHTLARQLRIPVVRYSPQLIAHFGYANGCFTNPTPSICPDHDGWTWIAEVEPHRFQWTRVTEPHHRPDRSWIPQGFQDLEAEHSRCADVTWRMAQTVAGSGYFLAGDSAAVLDPSSSHGVLQAIMSGMMAAHLAIRRLCDGADAQVCALTYQNWLSSRFQHDVKEMSRAYRAANLFGFAS
jgi:flavin-dependent dehydrogenase